MTSQLQKYILLSRGNFDPVMDSDDEDDLRFDPLVDDDEEDLDYDDDRPQSLLQSSGPSGNDSPDDGSNAATSKFKPGHRETLDVHKTKVTISDYHVDWASNVTVNKETRRMEDKQLTTHEITYDQNKGGDHSHVFVSGFSTNQIARISLDDPTKQQLFQFEDVLGDKFGDVQSVPHTLKFRDGEPGILWVGLEYAGIIVKLSVEKMIQAYEATTEVTGGQVVCFIRQNSECFLDSYDVRINVGEEGEGQIPRAINTHPHGFCFDKTTDNIWFTGKLTNTVGRLCLIDGTVKHFELPTLEAVPIYVALDADGNIWGTCLGNNTVFRVTTGINEGQEEGEVFEIPITKIATSRRPIKIESDPRAGYRYMWFSTEAGHSVCRVDLELVDATVAKQKKRFATKKEKSTICMCSQGCKKVYSRSKDVDGILREYHIPMSQQNMIGGALEFDAENNLWFQSYYNVAQGPVSVNPIPHDYIIKVDKAIMDDAEDRPSLEGVPVERFQVPSTGSILHRMKRAPNGKDILFTALGANRLGVIKFHQDVVKADIVDDIPIKQQISNAEAPATDDEKDSVQELVAPPLKGRDEEEKTEIADTRPKEDAVATQVDTGVATKRARAEKLSTGDTASKSTKNIFQKIDFKMEKLGSVVASSKIRATWIFQKVSITKNKTDALTETEGKVHRVELIWSKRSGKVSITVNGNAVVRKGTPLTQPNAPLVYKWNTTGSSAKAVQDNQDNSPLRFQIIAVINPNQTMIGRKQYELEVNDERFEDLT